MPFFGDGYHSTVDCSPGCGSKKRKPQNCTLVNGNMDQKLRSSSGFILTHTHLIATHQNQPIRGYLNDPLAQSPGTRPRPFLAGRDSRWANCTTAAPFRHRKRVVPRSQKLIHGFPLKRWPRLKIPQGKQRTPGVYLLFPFPAFTGIS